jgi:hypothetical protein
MATKEELVSIITLINNRRDEVLENNSAEEGSLEYQWISGIYNDITEYLEFQLT